MIAAGLGYPIIGCLRQDGAREVLQRYAGFRSARDMHGLLALHAEDTEFIPPGQNPIRGKDFLRRLYEWDFALQPELTMQGIQATRDVLTVDSLVERNMWFAALGIREVRLRPGTRFVLRGGLIAGIYPAAFSEVSERELEEKLPLLVSWLSRTRPNVKELLLPGGKFRYDRERAMLWLTILPDWDRSRSGDDAAPGRGGSAGSP